MNLLHLVTEVKTVLEKIFNFFKRIKINETI